MYGLIKKDLLMTRNNIKSVILIFAVYLFVAGDNSSFTFLPTFISIIIMMSTFSYDEYNKTNAYLSTLPNGRKNAIKAKYLSTLIILMASVMITVFASVAIQLVKGSPDWEGLISSTVGSCFGVILIQSILYPLIFKFGIEKSRIGMFVGAFSISGLVTLLMKLNFSIQIPDSILTLLNQYWMIIFPLLAVMLLFISYTLSKYLYLKKEF